MQKTRWIRAGWSGMMVFILLLDAPVWSKEKTQDDLHNQSSSSGYMLYCNCAGRFGNQVAHLLGALALARETGRILVLPPFIEYSHSRGVLFVPFDDVFRLDAVREYVQATTLEKFLRDPKTAKLWPAEKRRLYCFYGEEDACRLVPSSGQAFWKHFDIRFTETLRLPLDRSEFLRAPVLSQHAVVAMREVPGTYPPRAEYRSLQRYLQWSDKLRERGDAFIASKLKRPYLAVHLRNGNDWQKACVSAIEERTSYMSSGQCGLKRSTDADARTISSHICLPNEQQLIEDIKKLSYQNDGFASVFVGTDNQPYLNEISAALKHKIPVVTDGDYLMDLYMFTQADWFLANCVSSFSALAVRAREVDQKVRPTAFFGLLEQTQ